MPITIKLLPLSSVLILACSLPVMANEVNILIFGTSDVHGQMTPWNYGTDKVALSGSYAQISSFITDYQGHHDNVIVVDAGYIIQDNQIEHCHNVDNHPAITALNAMNYDIMVLGNHEFNFGIPVVDKIISEFKSNMLAANIYYKDSSKPYLPAATIIEKDGVKIGFIEATTLFVPEYKSKTSYVKQMEFMIPIAEIQKHIANLKKQAVDVIVLVTHMEFDNENNKLGTNVADVVE